MDQATEDSTISRLNELLDKKDEELDTARQANDDLERQIRFGVDWMLHSHHRPSASDLPMPRIELETIDATGHCQEMQVSMVMPQRGGTYTKVPLVYSKRSGPMWDLRQFVTTGELSEIAIGNIPSLIHDACFYMEKTGIPAYVVLDEEHRYEVVSLRPLRLKAVEQDAQQESDGSRGHAPRM